MEVALLTALIRGRALFQDHRFTEENLALIARRLILEKFEQNHIIFDFGTRGDKYYIVLKGRVSVWIPSDGSVKQAPEKSGKAAAMAM